LVITTFLAFRESVEEWGFLWAHRLLEDSFVRPNLDINIILKGILELSPNYLEMPIAAEGEVIKPYSKSSAKFKKLENLHNKLHIQKKELLAKPENHSLEKAMIITKKILWHVQIIGIGIATIDMLNEGEKHDQLIKHMDDKVDHVKKALNSKIFDMRLTDLKTKFLVIKNIFDLVIQMSDDFDFEEVSADETNLKKSRLDSAFVMCEEIFLLISEPHCELYKAAHRCIDIVSCFIIVHLGMLHMAVE